MKLVGLLVVALIVVVACGGDGPTPTPQPVPTATATPQPTATPQSTPTSTPQPIATPQPMATLTPEPLVAEGPLAPEIVGIHAWINSEPLKLSDLRGKVVLIDVWTYTCVNCIRTFPFLKIWNSKYADDGLVLIGVHTPEFEFEKKLENVQQAVTEYAISWPVAMDNDRATWNAYKNSGWPSKYLIDKDGIIRYTHFGEGRYAQVEKEIRELLEEAGADLSELDSELPQYQAPDPLFEKSPGAWLTNEIYAGWERGYEASIITQAFVGNEGYFDNPDKLIDYQDPDFHTANRIYLQGPWYNGPQSLRHGRETSQFEDYMKLKYGARSVNVVINPEGDNTQPFKVLVTLDDEYMTDSNKGEDVVIEEDGRSFLYVDEPKMYSVVQAPSYQQSWLKLSSNSPHFAVYAFTFGVYDLGP